MIIKVREVTQCCETLNSPQKYLLSVYVLCVCRRCSQCWSWPVPGHQYYSSSTVQYTFHMCIHTIIVYWGCHWAFSIPPPPSIVQTIKKRSDRLQKHDYDYHFKLWKWTRIWLDFYFNNDYITMLFLWCW